MAITNFIPEIWADSTEDRWLDRAVLADTISREHEGEASKGNTVHLTGVVAPKIKDYKANGRISTPDAISDTGMDLLIDQEKEFSFYVDDVDKTQAAGNLDVYTEAAGDGLVTDANEFIAAMLATNGTALSGSIPTTGAQAWDLIRDAWKGLSKAKAPKSDLTIAMNSEFAGLLLGNDSKLTSFDTSGDNSGLREATLGKLLQFRSLTSDDLPEIDTPAFIAYHKRSAAFVSQIESVEALRATNKFADIVRGLHVYGGKVVKPEGIQVFGINAATLTGTPASEGWSVTVTGAPTGGTYTLTVGSSTTAGIAFNADNAAITTALNALSGVSGVKVSGTATKTLGFKVPVKLTASGASLTGGTTPGVTVAAA